MKFQYSEDSIRKFLVGLAKTHPKLYNLHMDYFDVVRNLDYYDFMFLVAEECSKSNAVKRIKELETPFYEFRLPPVDKHEVLRIDFQVLDDYCTVMIINAYVKSNQPKPKLKRKTK